MRCWSLAELKQMLAVHFRDVSIHSYCGGPDGVWGDGLVVIAISNSI
jgi:hypothetical protein